MEFTEIQSHITAKFQNMALLLCINYICVVHSLVSVDVISGFDRRWGVRSNIYSFVCVAFVGFHRVPYDTYCMPGNVVMV